VLRSGSMTVHRSGLALQLTCCRRVWQHWHNCPLLRRRSRPSLQRSRTRTAHSHQDQRSRDRLADRAPGADWRWGRAQAIRRAAGGRWRWQRAPAHELLVWWQVLGCQPPVPTTRLRGTGQALGPPGTHPCEVLSVCAACDSPAWIPGTRVAVPELSAARQRGRWPVTSSEGVRSSTPALGSPQPRCPGADQGWTCRSESDAGAPWARTAPDDRPAPRSPPGRRQRRDSGARPAWWTTSR
jgi:hypothetical protein